MSKLQAAVSVYDTDSSLNCSDSRGFSDEIKSDMSSLYSSGSFLDVTGTQSEVDSGDSILEISEGISARTDSIKSLWSSADSSGIKGDDISECRQSQHYLTNDASPFIYDGRLIRYNTDRGINYDTPILFGSRKLTGEDTKYGYRASHLIFDPKHGTLAAGHDVNNQWSELPKYSLIGGLGNVSQLDGSLMSGSNNRILKLLQDQNNNQREHYPSSCAVIAGSNNSIENNSYDHSCDAIIGSSGMHVNNCNETVVLGMKSRPGEAPISNLNEAVVTRNMYCTDHVHAGPLSNEVVPVGNALNVNGNSTFLGDINVKGSTQIANISVENVNVSDTVKSDKVITRSIHGEHASFTDLDAKYIVQNERYAVGVNTGPTGGPSGQTGPTLIIRRGDGVNIVYANPVAGPVYIQLGTPEESSFERNRVIVVKDVTLENAATSSNNVTIYIPSVGISGPTAGTGTYPQPGVAQMEYYNQTNSALAVANNAGAPVGYVLNTVNGSVTLRYVSPLQPGSLATWTIENQFIGNPRANSATGLTFIPASTRTRSKLIRQEQK